MRFTVFSNVLEILAVIINNNNNNDSSFISDLEDRFSNCRMTAVRMPLCCVVCHSSSNSVLLLSEALSPTEDGFNHNIIFLCFLKHFLILGILKSWDLCPRG